MGTSSEIAEKVSRWAARHGVVMSSVFVPFSQSRNKGSLRLSLNWQCKISANGRELLTCDYSAGEARAPIYHDKDGPKPPSVDFHEGLAWECENGRAWRGRRGPILSPPLADVLCSLARDADALDYSGFEDWADNYGYDADSRKAEAIYRACLDYALKLRNGVGEAALQELQEIAQDY